MISVPRHRGRDDTISQTAAITATLPQVLQGKVKIVAETISQGRCHIVS